MPCRLSNGSHAWLRRRERVRWRERLRDQREMHQRPGLVQVHLPAGFHRPRTNSLRKSVTKLAIFLIYLIACLYCALTINKTHLAINRRE